MRMLLSRITLALVVALSLGTAARASDLGGDGRIHFANDALATYGFEDAAALAPNMRLVVVATNQETWSYDAIDAGVLQQHLAATADAIEGSQMLHWLGRDGMGLTIQDSATFSTLASQRVEVSFWGRAEGIEPVLEVSYGNQVDIATNRNELWARIPAIRTGRETSDGFIEYSTGPIDGSILARPIHDLFLTGRVADSSDTTLLTSDGNPTQHASAGMSIDAIEIRPAAGTIATASCTASSAAAVCGAAADCFYGRCVDSAAVWHPVPPLSMQREIVARVNHWASHLLADRSALARVDNAWITATSALASASATPKTFWGGLSQQVVAIRDTHTHLGSPYIGIQSPFAPRPLNYSGPLDVCFGPTVNDLGDGQLAYVIWAKGSEAISAFMVGDVVSAIDGMDPKTWVNLVYPQYVSSVPVVQGVEWAPSARMLGWLLATHASTLTMSRCTPGGSCTAQPSVNVSTLALNAISNGNYAHGKLVCTPRFSETVAGSHSDANGYDLFLSAELDGGTVAMDFDGFDPASSATWESSVNAAFTLPHSKVIVDARMGHGGQNRLGDYLDQQFRGTGAPTYLTLAARGTLVDPNDSSLFAFDWSLCGFNTSPDQCDVEDIFTYHPANASPPGLSSKVAWLNTDDVSNNDMVPRLLQGRANLRIFAPFPTYGALGSNVPLPPLMPDWGSGSIAVSDGRYGTSIAGAESAAGFESGTGVSPDQIVTQTVSDVLNNHDSIVAAATTWLAQ